MDKLIVAAYFMLLGYLAARYKLDEALARKAHELFRAAVREAIEIRLELAPAAGPPRELISP
jgi:hypothetical protein